MMKCVECKFCVLKDYGYSNYTVEGTNADCFLDMNPDFPVDNYYGETPEHDFANVCPRFKVGEPIYIDCDHEQGHMLNYVDDPEVREIIEKELMWEVLGA